MICADTEVNYSYSILVPLFNEESNVIPLISGIFEVVGNHPQFWELVLVDDGSRDRTVELIEEQARLEPRIRLIRHDVNRGLGGAIRTGLSHSNGDLVLYTDADLPFDFSYIPQLFSGAGPERVVAGYRLNRDEGVRRWVLSRGYNLLIARLFWLRVRDVNFACKIIPRRLAKLAVLESNGSFIDAEILLEARRLGLEIEQYPLRYYPRTRGESTLSRPGVIFSILQEMGRYLKRCLMPGRVSLPEKSEV
jgi:glycosyltransferase involved in cell wall biosynthesis